MALPITSVTASAVTVLDPTGRERTIPVCLTPKRGRLTQDSKRRLLATGFLYHISTGWSVDPDLIRGMLAYIARRVRACAEAPRQ